MFLTKFLERPTFGISMKTDGVFLDDLAPTHVTGAVETLMYVLYVLVRAL